MTFTVEFTDYVEDDSIRRQLKSMPFNPSILCSCYNKYTYPIQHVNTRPMIKALKISLAKHKIRLVGRFAEWEYFNMDAAIESAIRCCDEFYA